MRLLWALPPALTFALTACSGGSGGESPGTAIDIPREIPGEPGLVLYRDSLEGAFIAADPGGSEQWRLAAAPGLEAILLADCTPDGRRLAYVVADPATNISTFYIQGQEPLPPVEVEGLVQSVAWSPDGSRIALARLDAETFENHLLLLDPASGELQELPSGEDSPGPPRWSPDGQRITFSAIGESGSDIYVLRVGDEAPAKLDREEFAFDPDWSPDGEFLIFSASAGERAYQLFTMNSDGSGERQLTMTDTLKSYPRWSADGSHIGYAGTVFVNMPSVSTSAASKHLVGVWVARNDGSDERLLTDLAQDARFLGWCSEGEWLEQGWEPL